MVLAANQAPHCAITIRDLRSRLKIGSWFRGLRNEVDK